jgi:predicted deacetylase
MIRTLTAVLPFLATFTHAQDSLLFVVRVDDITSRTTQAIYMPRGILPFQDMAESRGAVVSWAVMPARLLEPNVNTAGELGRQLRTTAARGHELVLHGYDHICDLDGSSGHEMYHPDHIANYGRHFTYQEQSATIRAGMKLLQDSVGVRPTSFVPPGHYSDDITHQVLTDEGFRAIGIARAPGLLTHRLYNIGTSPDFAWALTQASYAAKRTETLAHIRTKAASQGHYTFLLHDPFTRPGYLDGLVIRWAAEILDSVKAEYGSGLRFVTIGQLEEAIRRTSTAIDEPLAEAPRTVELLPNHPNPFNPSTVIGFRLSVFGQTSLKIYDLLGRDVAVLLDAPMPPGAHSVTFDATGLPSGIYVVRLSDGVTSATRRILLLR